MRIGIYGGSYNPIHNGHTALAQWLVTEGYVDELWLVVSPQNPLKRHDDLLDDEARLYLARLALHDLPDDMQLRIRVSDVEFRLPRPSYMADTLAYLRSMHPEDTFCLVVGADNWARFRQWVRPEEILQHHPLLVFPRDGYPLDKTMSETSHSRVTFLDAPRYDISSTQLRGVLSSDPDFCARHLSPSVWDEIRREGYYAKAKART